MASFDSAAFDTAAFSSLAFFFDGESPPTPSPSPAPTSTGGYGWSNLYDRELQRRKRRKRELEEAEAEVKQLKDATTREIGLLLQKQEAEDARRASVERLREMLPRMDRAELSDGAYEALERARIRGTLSALSNFYKELKRMQEDEEMAVLMLLLND